MTLRRHTLRIHVPKEQWRYHCPYCVTVFVEPTGYQNHVEHRHPGRSCTFGCARCSYSTLCSTSFWNHIEKHSHNVTLEALNVADVSETLAGNNENLHLFTVDDEMGVGWSDNAIDTCDLRGCSDVVIAKNAGDTTDSFVRYISSAQKGGFMKKVDHLYSNCGGPVVTALRSEVQAVPEVQIQVEVKSDDCKTGKNFPKACKSNPEFLPDGQIDFDLD
ncbi:unnamed protein product [Soboliphyme baturini]|uniref:C2H2-type domain-containing protein n=1 Tax=Soboliphyme baturini TaxID=241478 RepID=A0A183ISR6_9BILA|nr:unnamed protein product [Soboliphyme baturini]